MSTSPGPDSLHYPTPDVPAPPLRVVPVLLIIVALVFVALLLILPLVLIFSQAFSKGVGFFAESIVDPTAWSAIKLTLLVAAISVPVNIVFGLCASWAVAKFQFPGKALLVALIELPLSVSPVVSGLVFIMLFGAHTLLGEWLIERNMQVIFAVPGIVLATVFVTFPYVARQLIPLMQQQGPELEEVSAVMGASGFQMFWHVTLPRVKWALVYGVILCNARAMGEFGAVSVVSGHIRGQTNTLPLHVEILYNEYNFAAAFACASVLVLLALITLVIKHVIERLEN